MIKISLVMKEFRRGPIVKFHTPYEDENPNQLYVVLEYMEDGNQSRAKIETLNTGLSFPPIYVVYVKDLMIEEVQTFQLDCYVEFGNI